MDIKYRVNGGEVKTLKKDRPTGILMVWQKLKEMYGPSNINYDAKNKMYFVTQYDSPRGIEVYINLPDGRVEHYFPALGTSEEQLLKELRSIYGPHLIYSEEQDSYTLGGARTKQEVLYRHVLKIYEGDRSNQTDERVVWIPHTTDVLEHFDYFVADDILYKKWCVEDNAIHAAEITGKVCVVNYEEENHGIL